MWMERRVSRSEWSKNEHRMHATHNIELKWTRKSISDGLTWWLWDTLNVQNFCDFFSAWAAATVGSYVENQTFIHIGTVFFFSLFLMENCYISFCVPWMCRQPASCYTENGNVRVLCSVKRQQLTKWLDQCAGCMCRQWVAEAGEGSQNANLGMKIHLVACRCRLYIYIYISFFGLDSVRAWCPDEILNRPAKWWIAIRFHIRANFTLPFSSRKYIPYWTTV